MNITAPAPAGRGADGAASATEALAVAARTHPRAMVTELRLSSAAGPALDGSCNVGLPVPCLPETLIRQLRPVLG